VQALPSKQEEGQEAGGSQVSPASTTLLPQAGRQLLSLLALQPEGQQPSPWVQVVMLVVPQIAVQVAALPESESMVQGLPSSQEEGQEPGGSQVSPGSTTLLPHTGEQLESVLALQPEGQQPSPPVQAVITGKVQATSQVRELPDRVSVVQLLPSEQETGQVPGGSQVSPGSVTLLPQTGEQFESLLALQPEGQQPSPPTQETIAG
jgi:hypothetical protein